MPKTSSTPNICQTPQTFASPSTVSRALFTSAELKCIAWHQWTSGPFRIPSKHHKSEHQSWNLHATSDTCYDTQSQLILAFRIAICLCGFLRFLPSKAHKKRSKAIGIRFETSLFDKSCEWACNSARETLQCRSLFLQR
jgi:hypothetical protein